MGIHRYPRLDVGIAPDMIGRLPVALGIMHVIGVPEREDTLARTKRALGLDDGSHKASFYVEYHNRAPDGVRNRLIREAVLKTGIDYCLFTEDDILIAPRFWDVLGAILEAAPKHVIGFHTRHPEARDLARAGHHWASSVELVGTMYLFPRAELAHALAWENTLPRGHKVTSDTMLGVWAYVHKKRIWQPIPTLIDHDNTVASTTVDPVLEGRTPTVTWHDAPEYGWSIEDMCSPNFWRLDEGAAPHQILPYQHLREELRC